MPSFHPNSTNNFLLSNFKMRKGSTRFPDATRQTGGGSMVISQKPSKKLRTLSSVAEMDKLNWGKRVKLPKKPLDDGYTVNLVTVPRKLRSVPSAVINKRHVGLSTTNRINAISRSEIPSTGGNKKVKLDPDEQHSLMKNEEEAIAALLALTGNDNNHEIKLNNKISEENALKTNNLVQTYAQIHDLNESRNTVDVKKDDGNKLRKRCSSHVYICQIIKNLKTAQGKTVISLKEAKTETTPENFMSVDAGINLNESIPVSKPTIQDQPSGCGAHSYFGDPYCDPSQWSRPAFPKQQMWMNPFMYKPPHSGSYVQPSLHNVVGSKHYPSWGYDENGAPMFCMDNPPTLKLALQ